MAMVDAVLKETHFIPIMSPHKTNGIAKISMRKIFTLHGLPKGIVAHRDTKFRYKFWKSFWRHGYLVKAWSTIHR